MSTLIVDGKHSAFQIFGSSDSCQDFSSSESYNYRGRKVADPPERKILNVANPHFSQVADPPERKILMWQTHISHSVVDPHVRGNNETHCVADPQVIVKRTKGLKVVRILEALKAMVTEEGRWRTHRKGKF